jgi:membrane protease YdiL (CAAX protease family)
MVLLVPVCAAALAGLSGLWVGKLDLTLPQILFLFLEVSWSAHLLGYIYVVVTYKYQLPFASSIAWVSPSRALPFYLAGGVILAVTVTAVGSFFPPPEEQLPIERMLQGETFILLMAVGAVLFAPAVEEIIFQGFFFPVFERQHGAVIAILVTGAPFTLMHGPQLGWHWQGLTLIMGVAMVLGVVRARTGSIIATTLVHAAYNATLSSGLLATHDQIKEL